MVTACAAADLIVSRSGASTTAELACLGKPSILVPFPHATDNHQEQNARAFEDAGAATVILDVRLLAGPAVEPADRRSEHFALFRGVDRNRQLLADFTQLHLAEAYLRLGDAAIAVTDRHGRVGCRQTGPG